MQYYSLLTRTNSSCTTTTTTITTTTITTCRQVSAPLLLRPHAMCHVLCLTALRTADSALRESARMARARTPSCAKRRACASPPAARMLTCTVAAHTFLSLRASIPPLLFKLLSTSRCIPCKPPYTLLSDPPTCVSSTTGMKPTYIGSRHFGHWTVDNGPRESKAESCTSWC